MTRCRCVGNRHTCGIQNTNPNVVVVGQGGPKGIQGATGVQGAAGAGTQGVQGTVGPIGPGGGAQGTTGAQGETGPQGLIGVQGTTGAGAQGSSGTQGTDGIQGAIGAGAQGTIGSQGIEGAQGGGVSLQQLSDAIAGVALASTDELSEGTINKYFTVGRVSYAHIQDEVSDTWTVAHGLGFKPNVTVQDSAGTIYEGEISYTNLDSLVISFSSAFSGKAFLS